MSDELNGAKPLFAVRESAITNRYNYGEIVKRNKASIVVKPWRDGREVADASPRLIRGAGVFQGDHDAALKLVRDLNGLDDRETQTRRQYAAQRRDIIAAARASIEHGTLEAEA